jgi:hypothetical protein
MIYTFIDMEPLGYLTIMILGGLFTNGIVNIFGKPPDNESLKKDISSLKNNINDLYDKIYKLNSKICDQHVDKNDTTNT